MIDAIVKIAEILSTTDNQMALFAFLLLLMIAFILIVVMKMFKSLIDFKREVYKAGKLPDRGKKGERY